MALVSLETSLSPLIPVVEHDYGNSEKQCYHGHRVRQKIAIANKEGLILTERDFVHEKCRRKQVSAGQYAAVRIDECRDSGVGGPDEIPPRLDGSQHRLIQVLVRSRATAKPGVVGHVDQKGSARFDETPHQVRVDGFVAYEGADILTFDRSDDDVGPGCEIGSALNDRLGKKKATTEEVRTHQTEPSRSCGSAAEPFRRDRGA